MERLLRRIHGGASQGKTTRERSLRQMAAKGGKQRRNKEKGMCTPGECVSVDDSVSRSNVFAHVGGQNF